jgi:SAM-dependent methyltransferase
MALAAEYRNQFSWRAWSSVFAVLPPLDGKVIVDLGCGVGDVTAELARRGARAIGLDMNEDLLAAARSVHVGQIDFVAGDLRRLPSVGPCDGIWCSFAAAYLKDLDECLRSWAAQLRCGGWLAITEVDDLFGHEPLTAETRSLLEAYARASLSAGRYDFHMGRKLEEKLRRAGWRVDHVLQLEDRELAFSGPAEPAVLEAWRSRLARMSVLQTFCGDAFSQVCDELMTCLSSQEHQSRAKVICCIATRHSE